MILPPLKLILISFAISLAGSFHFGYMLIVPNSAAVALQDFLNSSFYNHHGVYLYHSDFNYIWPLFLNLMTIGGFVGSLILRPLADNLGRNRSFYVVALLQAVGSLASALAYFADSWELLSLGRLISGVSVGLSLGLQPMFFSEISPKSVLGFLNSMTGTSLQIGLVIGSVLALPAVFGSIDKWHLIFWFEFATTFVTIAILPFIYESPKHLLANNSDYSLARESLLFFTHENIDENIKEIEDEISSEKENIGLVTIIKKSYLRMGLLIGCVTMLGCQSSGISAISFYSTHLFIDAGVPPDIAPYATVAVACTTLIAAIISSFVIDHVGRRPLILVGLISLAALNLLFVIFTFVGNMWPDSVWPGYVCVVVIVIFAFMFGIGPAVITWFVMAELMPQNARSAAISFVQALLWVTICISNSIFYPLEDAVGEWSFFMFIVPLVIISIWLYFKFPETKNKTPTEIISKLGYRADKGEKNRDETNEELKNLFSRTDL